MTFGSVCLMRPGSEYVTPGCVPRDVLANADSPDDPQIDGLSPFQTIPSLLPLTKFLHLALLGELA